MPRDQALRMNASQVPGRAAPLLNFQSVANSYSVLLFRTSSEPCYICTALPFLRIESGYLAMSSSNAAVEAVAGALGACIGLVSTFPLQTVRTSA